MNDFEKLQYNMGFTSHYFLFQTFILATLLDTPPWSMGVTGTVEVVLMKQVLSVLWTEDWSWLAAQWFFHDNEHSDDQCSKNNTNQRLSSKSKIKWWKQSERPEISRESPHWHNKANPSSKQIQLHCIPHTVNQARTSINCVWNLLLRNENQHSTMKREELFATSC